MTPIIALVLAAIAGGALTALFLGLFWTWRRFSRQDEISRRLKIAAVAAGIFGLLLVFASLSERDAELSDEQAYGEAFGLPLPLDVTVRQAASQQDFDLVGLYISLGADAARVAAIVSEQHMRKTGEEADVNSPPQWWAEGASCADAQRYEPDRGLSNDSFEWKDRAQTSYSYLTLVHCPSASTLYAYAYSI